MQSCFPDNIVFKILALTTKVDFFVTINKLLCSDIL
jgi:hypothetical protein